MSDSGSANESLAILGSRKSLAPGGRIKLYDFRRPDKFSKEQLRTMQLVAEGFARSTLIRLSSILRLPCDVRLGTVDQMTYEEFMDPLPSPCGLFVASMKPLKGQVVVHIDAAGSDAMLERSYGATPVVVDKPLASGSMSDIEVTQMELIAIALLEELGDAWKGLEEVQPKLEGIENEARFCKVVHPNEMIVLTSFNLSIGAVQGKLDIVYPFLVLEPVIGKLSAKYWYEVKRDGLEAPSLKAARRANMDAEIICDAGTLSIVELRALRTGSTIAIPGWDAGDSWLRLGGQRVAELSETVRDGTTIKATIRGGGSAGAPTTAPDTMVRLSDEVRGAVQAIESSVSGALKAMAGRLDELKGGQEDLSDRVLFGQADQAGAGSAAGHGRRPFSSLSGAQPEALALFLASERPQVCALVLSHLDDSAAARILSLLPETVQADITRRIAIMGGIAPETLSGVESVLAKRLASADRTGPAAGGIQKVVGILNFAPRDTERLVINALSDSDPDLAESIKRTMFVFEDIIILDDESIAAVLEEAAEQDFIVAMKPMKEEERQRLLERIPEGKRKALGAAYAALGRVRLSECDAAGFRVVEIIRRLESEGRIGILRQGE